MVGRGIAVFGLMGCLKLYNKKKTLSFKELVFIWYAGLIRGAIAFGLVLRIDDVYTNKGVIISTSLTLVVVTTVVFGSTIGPIGKYLFHEEDLKQLNLTESVTIGPEKDKANINDDSGEESVDYSSDDDEESEYEE